jgi:hypothetical protein
MTDGSERGVPPIMRSGDGTEIEKQLRMVIVMTDQDSKMAKVIRESHWNVKRKYDADQAKKALDRHYQELPKEVLQLPCGFGKPSRDRFNHVPPQPIAVTRRLKCERTPSITIAAITPSVTIQHIRVINGRTGTYLKLKRVCNGISLKDQKPFTKYTGPAPQHR